MMDHSALQDLGMTSIGHRLNLLRAVWELKREQGIALGEDDWRPQGESSRSELSLVQTHSDRRCRARREEESGAQCRPVMESHTGTTYVVTTKTVRAAANEQKRDWSGSNEIMQDFSPAWKRTDCVSLLSGRMATRSRICNGRISTGGRATVRMQIWYAAIRVGNVADGQSTSKASRRASQLFPSSLASSASSYAPAPLSSDSATFKDSFTPTNPSASYPFDSPSHPPVNGSKFSANPPPPFTRMMSGSSIVTTSTPPSQTLARSLTTSATSRIIPPTLASTATSSTALVASSTTATSVSPTPPQGMMGDLKDKSEGGTRGFRVTLDDPCWKVLPAALKKYKIDDDWKVYALFICFGTSGELFLDWAGEILMPCRRKMS